MRTGFVTFVGRPNTGKSTLITRILGTKVSIVSDKPQTTRTQVRGVLTRPDAQIVFVFSRALAREATDEEFELLRDAYEGEAAELTDADARALLNIGESDWQSDAPIELAALTSVVRAVFNTSESQTRE